MIISIDYDDTWSADPSLWKEIARRARERGHKVILVTNRMGSRRDAGDVWRSAGDHVSQIIFAGMGPKRAAALGAGYDVDVWIDNAPETVAGGMLAVLR